MKKAKKAPKKASTKSTKDRIINIRVSKQTYDKMRDAARDNSESISNALRKLINDTFDIAAEVREDILGTDSKKSDTIVTYYRGTAGAATKCSKCAVAIKKAETIIIGEANSGKKYFFCTKCK